MLGLAAMATAQVRAVLDERTTLCPSIDRHEGVGLCQGT